MINEKDIQKFIDQEVKKRKILELMQLSHWDLVFEVGDTIGDFNAGECLSDPAYFLANITLNPKYMTDMHTVRETFVHELCHLLISPVEGYLQTVLIGLQGDETQEGRQQSGVQRIAIEQTVTRMTRTFMKLLYPESKPEVLIKSRLLKEEEI